MTFITIRLARSLSLIAGTLNNPNCKAGTKRHDIFVAVITFLFFHHTGLRFHAEEKSIRLLWHVSPDPQTKFNLNNTSRRIVGLAH